MSNPKDDAELARAIEERTIPVDDPAPPPKPTASRKPEEAEFPPGESELGKNVDDFQLDVPAPEGIDP